MPADNECDGSSWALVKSALQSPLHLSRFGCHWLHLSTAGSACCRPYRPLQARAAFLLDALIGVETDQTGHRLLSHMSLQGARVGLVGANGEGKSTLVKLMLGELTPKSGTSLQHPQARIGVFAQSNVEHLVQTRGQLSPLEHMKVLFPEGRDALCRSGSYWAVASRACLCCLCCLCQGLSPNTSNEERLHWLSLHQA